jgi:hypothetical protein
MRRLDGTIKKPVEFRAAQMCLSEPWEWSVANDLAKP